MKKYLPFLILAILSLIAYFSPLREYLSFSELKNQRETLKHFVAVHPLLSPLLFIGVYFLMTALSVPGALFLTLFGGFLFSQPWSTLYVLIGASSGATVIFLAAKTAFKDLFREKLGSFLQKMEKGFRENSASYLLFLRFVPLFPFWVVNLAPAFFGVSLRTFIWTTVVGILPGSFVYTQAGVGLGAILEEESFSLSALFNWKLKIALIALGIFALIPIIIKFFKKRRT